MENKLMGVNENQNWTSCEFVYSLLNGGTYRLRYWRRGDERVVACADLRESLGEIKETFKNNFMGENILPHNKDFSRAGHFVPHGFDYQKNRPRQF